jgi:hypothetical protein
MVAIHELPRRVVFPETGGMEKATAVLYTFLIDDLECPKSCSSSHDIHGQSNDQLAAGAG